MLLRAIRLSCLLVSLAVFASVSVAAEPQDPLLPPEPSPQEAQATAERAIAQLNTAQQSYFQRNQRFANTVSTLQGTEIITIPRRQYNVAINPNPDSVYHFAVPRRLDQYAIVGAVFMKPNSSPDKPQFDSIVCVSPLPGNAIPPLPTFLNGRAACGELPPQATPQSTPQPNSNP
jgi:hypothetical protein